MAGGELDRSTIRELLAAYQATAEEWDRLQGQASAANRVFDENHRVYKMLRDSGEGRAGIGALMAHPMTGVRLTAAAHSLAWSPAEAAGVLEAIQAGPGLHSVSARYTLIEFRKGRLSHDW